MRTTGSKIDEAYQRALVGIRSRSVSLEGRSIAERIARLRAEERRRIINKLTAVELASLRWAWRFWARPKQIEPSGEWSWWYQQGGRGSGKTRTAAEWIRDAVDDGDGPVLLAGPTLGHVKSYMLGGDGQASSSMLFDIFPPEHRKGNARLSDKEIRFWNGTTGYISTGEDPEFKGPNLRRVWIDEPTKVRHVDRWFHHIEMALRATGPSPARGIITTNPPEDADASAVDWMKTLVAREDVFAVLSALDENAANLDARYVRRVQIAVGGTDLERRDRFGEYVEDAVGALFMRGPINDGRVTVPPLLRRIAVVVDPAASDSPRADMVGIVATGIDDEDELYVLEDRSGKMDPEGYAGAAIELYLLLRRLHPDAEVFVLGEDSKFGKHVPAVLRAAVRERRGKAAAQAVDIRTVTAVGDKRRRAQAPSVLYRRGQVHHVGDFPELEAEMVGWREGQRSPGRIDALVHGINHLAQLDEEQELRLEERFDGLARAQEAMSAPAFSAHAEPAPPTRTTTWELDRRV